MNKLLIVFILIGLILVSSAYPITKIEEKWYLDGIEIIRDADKKLKMEDEFVDGKFIGYTPEGEKVTSKYPPTGVRIMDCGVGNALRQESWYDSDTSRTVTSGDICMGVIYYIDGDINQFNLLLQTESAPGPDGFVILGGKQQGQKKAVGGYGSVTPHFCDGPYIVRVIDADGSSYSYWYDLGEVDHQKLDFIKKHDGEPPIVVKGKVIIEGVTPPSDEYGFIKIGTCPEWSILDDSGNFELAFYNIPPREFNFRLELLDFGNGIIQPDPRKTAAQLPEVFPDYGKLSGITINIKKPDAWVKGRILDQYGNAVDGPICVILQGKALPDSFPIMAESVYFEDYFFSTLAGHFDMYVGLLHGGYGPTFYMYPEPNIGTIRYPLDSFYLEENPAYSGGPYKLFVEKGDTVIQDVVCRKPNSFVYAKIVNCPDPLKYRALGIEASGGGYYSRAMTNTQSQIASIAVDSTLAKRFSIRMGYFPVYDEYNYKIGNDHIEIGDTTKIYIIPR